MPAVSDSYVNKKQNNSIHIVWINVCVYIQMVVGIRSGLRVVCSGRL